MSMVKIEINTEVEAYPVLSIRPDERGVSNIEIPAAMLDALDAAERAVERVETEIMRYVADRYGTPAAREWLADYAQDRESPMSHDLEKR